MRMYVLAVYSGITDVTCLTHGCSLTKYLAFLFYLFYELQRQSNSRHPNSRHGDQAREQN
jgi:hypothetical protein